MEKSDKNAEDTNPMYRLASFQGQLFGRAIGFWYLVSHNLFINSINNKKPNPRIKEIIDETTKYLQNTLKHYRKLVFDTWLPT